MSIRKEIAYNPEKSMDKDKKEQFFKAARQGEMEIINLLDSHKIDIDSRDASGCTPLMHACAGGHVNLAELLIQKGADINLKDNRGRTALFTASAWGQTETVKLLIQQGADIHQKNNEGKTALSDAVWKGYIEIASIFIENGADIHNTLPKAVIGSHKAIVELLIKRGADVNHKQPGFEYNAFFLSNESDLSRIKNKAFWTPLMHALKIGHKEIADLLIQHGAEIYYPLFYAVLSGHQEIIDFVIQNSFLIIDKTKNISIEEILIAHPAVFDFLTQGVIDIDQALIYTVKAGYLKIALLLIQKGADINARDSKNNPALFYAAQARNKKMMDLLSFHGALPLPKETK